MNATQTIETKLREPNYAMMEWDEDKTEEPATIDTVTEDNYSSEAAEEATGVTVTPVKMWGYEATHTTIDSDNPAESYHRVDLLPTGYGSTSLLAAAHLSAENAGEVSRAGIRETGIRGLAAKLQDKVPGLRHIGAARTVNYIFQDGNREPSERQIERLQKVAYKAIKKSDKENDTNLAEQITSGDIYITLDGMGVKAEVNRVEYASKPLTKSQVRALEAKFEPTYELDVTDMTEIRPDEMQQVQPYKPAGQYALAA